MKEPNNNNQEEKNKNQKSNILKQALTFNINNKYNDNEFFIKELAKTIDINPLHNNSYNLKKYDTSYKVFHNETINIDTLIFYLSTKNQIGVTDELINLLYTKFQNDSLFYIYQICSLITYKEYINTIENYLLDSCVDRMKFSLITFWMTFSNENSQQLEKLQQNIEMTMVNNRRYSLNSNKHISNKFIENENNHEFGNQIIKEGIIKQYKLNYFNYVYNFYNDLKDLCELLKNTSKKKRKEELKKNLIKFNKMIKQEKNKSLNNMPKTDLIINYFYEGILLPFNDNIDTSDEYCNIIVKFIPELSKCYHSKARVPILLTVECVKLIEIKLKEELRKEKEKNEIKKYNSIKSFLEDYENDNENDNDNDNEINNNEINNSSDDLYIYIPDNYNLE